jgi:hypothetical protein
MVFQKAHYWLRQPSHRVISHLAGELGVTVLQEPGGPATQPLQAPAVSPTPRFPAERPDLDHGGIGEHPDSPRSRRVPPAGSPPPPYPGRSLLLAGGMA